MNGAFRMSDDGRLSVKQEHAKGGHFAYARKWPGRRFERCPAEFLRHTFSVRGGPFQWIKTYLLYFRTYSFSVGNYIYLEDGGLYQFDPVSEQVKPTNIAYGPVSQAKYFVIGGKGYFIGSSNGEFQVWEFDPSRLGEL